MTPLDLKPGRIVWARVKDSDGVARQMKKRPLVVIRGPTPGDPTFDWLASTTTVPSPESAPYTLSLDYTANTQGHRYTKLREPCYLDCRWTGVMAIDEIENPERDARGVLHAVQLEIVLEIVAKLRSLSGESLPGGDASASS